MADRGRCTTLHDTFVVDEIIAINVAVVSNQPLHCMQGTYTRVTGLDTVLLLRRLTHCVVHPQLGLHQEPLQQSDLYEPQPLRVKDAKCSLGVLVPRPGSSQGWQHRLAQLLLAHRVATAVCTYNNVRP